MIDNNALVQSPAHRGISVLTGEGGKLRTKMSRGKDYELGKSHICTMYININGLA